MGMSANDPSSEATCASHLPTHPVACQRVDVVTGSRLHFGLLSTQPVDRVCYGGCGLMIRRPSVHVRAVRSDRFRFAGEFESRCREVAQRFVDHFGLPSLPPCDLQLLQSSDAHAGLGSGTQINLAVATALTTLFQMPISLEQLAAEIAARGRRSAIGVHGFAHGGLVVESGTPEGQTLGRLSATQPFPSHWRILLVRPRQFKAHVHGGVEQAHFAQLAAAAPAERDALLAIMNDEILPAIIAHDFDAFCESVSRYNHTSGMLFAPVQGGAYNGPQLEALVATLRDAGCQGIGQSSWGPTIFAFCPDQDSAEAMRQRLLSAGDGNRLKIEITQARNKPASVCAKRRSSECEIE